MNYKESAKLLQEYDDFLLVTHINPDGDTMGSAAALCSALRRAGKTAWLYPNRQAGDKILKYVDKYFAPDGYKPRSVVAVDTASEKLLPDGFRGRTDFCVDHHPSNSHYAKEYLVCDDKASCGEIILKLIKALTGSVTAEEATLLYMAVSTDTGCFRYSNTCAETFAAAAELLRRGADSNEINTAFFRKASRARMKLEGLIYNGMKFYRDGLISVVTVTKDMLAEAGTDEDDLEDIASLANKAEGSALGITIRETDNGCKISMRSDERVNSSDICAIFGGGGHSRAAGCTMDTTPEHAEKMLLSVIDEVWK